MLTLSWTICLGKREKNVRDLSSRCLATFDMLEVPHAFHDWHRVALAQRATEGCDVNSSTRWTSQIGSIVAHIHASNHVMDLV